MKDGLETAEGVKTANSATNGGGGNDSNSSSGSNSSNGELVSLSDKALNSKQQVVVVQERDGSPTLLAIRAEEVPAGDSSPPLGGTLTLLQRAAEPPQSASSVSPDTNGDDDGSRSNNGNKSDNGKSDKVFTCSICNRCFGYKHVLQNHERTHTGEKPFECPECHKRFTRDHHLKTHMRLHTGEKPYQCSHCDRHFVQVANLRRHLRVHTGERPYACQSCSSRFSDSNQLKAHMLIHRGEKPFQCSECLGRFRRRHHLIHHKCPKDEANLGKPRRGRRPRAYDQLQRSGDDEDDPDPLRISENDEDEVLDHNNHSSSEPEHSTPAAQVIPVIKNNSATTNNGRKTNHAIRILTPQQRELFLRDKVSMQTQAIDMRVSSEAPLRTLIVPRTTNFVEGVLDLSNSRSDSEIEPIDEEVHVDCLHEDNEEDDIVDVVNGSTEDEAEFEDDPRAGRGIVTPRTLRNFAIRRTERSSVMVNHRPSVLVGKMVEPMNGTSSSYAKSREDLRIRVNGGSGHMSSDEDVEDQRREMSPHPIPLTKKASIATA